MAVFEQESMSVMRRPARLIAAALVFLLLMPHAAMGRSSTPDSSYPSQARLAFESGPSEYGAGPSGIIPGRVLVQYKSEPAAQVASKQHGLARTPASGSAKGRPRVENVEVPPGRETQDLINELNADPRVELAGPATFSELAYTSSPDDPAFNDTGNWTSDGQLYPDAKGWWIDDQPGSLRTSTLWPSLEVGGGPGYAVAHSNEITIATIDTGFYMTHPDKGSNIVAGWDYFESFSNAGGYITDGDVTPVPESAPLNNLNTAAHGTCVAGEVGAATNNGTGVASVGFDNTVTVYKVHGIWVDGSPDLGIAPGSAVIFTDAVTNAMYGAVDDGADVISLSLGSTSPSSAGWYQLAVDYANAHGVLVVAATGNAGDEAVLWPARCDGAVGVGSYGLAGASGTDIEQSDFTNWGDGLDILAPGRMIYGFTRPDYDDDGSGTLHEPGYMFWQGTSMATPAFAGAAGMLWRFDPDLSADELTSTLFATAEDMGPAGFDSLHGWGAVRPVAAYGVIADTSAPLVSDDALGAYATDPAQFTITATDVSGSGIDRIEYKVDGSATQTVPAATAPVSVTGEGSHAVRYVAYDMAGNRSAPGTANLRIDTQPPTVSDDADVLYSASPAGFTITASDASGSGIDRIEYKVDGSATQTVPAATAPVSVTGEGAHTVRYVAYDVAGNRSPPGTANLRIDTQAPTVSDDADALYSATPADFTITASDVSGSGIDRIEYKIDSGTTQTVSAATAPVSVTGEGAHTVGYVAYDVAGNMSSLGTASLRIDTAAPAVSDDADALYSTTPANFTIAASDGSGSGIDYIEYRIDSGTTQTVSAATAPVSVTGEGAHTVRYLAYDMAGNVSTLGSAALTIDTAAPIVNDDAVAYYRTDPAQFTITASDGSGSGIDHIEYKVDGNATQTVPASTAPVSVTGEGAHTVRYLAYDNAGHPSLARTADLTIDTIAPTVSDDIVASYPGSASFTLSAVDGGSGVVTIAYRIDSGSTKTVDASSVPLVVSTPGTRTITYLATDAAGNPSPPAVTVFYVGADDVPPDVSDDAPPYSASDPTNVTISAEDPGSGVASLSYSIDGSATRTVAASSEATLVTGEGTHTLVYLAEDTVGNVSNPVQTQFVIDTQPPTVSDDADALYSASPAEFTITADDASGSGIDRIEYRIDSGTTQTVSAATAPVSVTGEGAHTVRYLAYDMAGNVSTLGSAALTIDTAAPIVNDDAVAYYAADPAQFTITAGDGSGSGIDYIEYRVDGNATQTVSAATAPVSVTGEGAHTVRYLAYDNAGHPSLPRTADLTIDTIVPTAFDDASTYYNSSPAQFTITAGDGSGSGIDYIEYKVDSSATQTVPASTAPLSVSGEGAHTVRYVACDAAGNMSALGTADLRIDTTAPTASDNAAAYYTVDPAQFTITASDGSGSGIDRITYQIDTQAPQTVFSSSAPVSVSGDGAHTVTYSARDAAGNDSIPVTRPLTINVNHNLTSIRLADSDRFSTAVAIAREGFDTTGASGTQWGGIRHVIIASGEDRAAADPLSAAGLCWAYDAPLLLVSSSNTPNQVKQAVKEIASQAGGTVTIHIVGGKVSVPDARYNDLKAYVGSSGSLKSHRVAGADRFSTAAAIARDMKAQKGTPSTVLIANGAD